MTTRLPKWTLVLPFVVFHVGTWLSLAFKIHPGTSFWYWPIPLGLVLVQWWGWRVVPWIFVNAMLSGPLWGIHSFGWSFLFALPETLVLALSYALFRIWKQGAPQLPSLASALHYLVFGIAIPVGVGALFLQALLLIKTPVRDLDHFLWLWMVSSLNVFQSTLALSPLLLISLTPVLAKMGWAVVPEEKESTAYISAPASRIEIALSFGLSAPLAALLPVDYFPFIVSLFAMWAILRMELRAALILNLWLLWATLTFKDFNLAIPVLPTSELPVLLRLQLIWIIISIAALTGGYTLHDLRLEVHLRKTAMRALRESQTRFREIANLSKDVIFLVDRKNGAPVYLNPATQHILGEPPESLLSKPDWLRSRLDEDQDSLQAEMHHPQFWHEPKVVEMRLAIPGKGVRWIRLRITPSQDTSDLPRIPGFLSDITEAKAQEAHEAKRREQMQQTDHLASIGKLVGGVAHEINNPNSLILLGAEALENETLPQLSPEEKKRVESWITAIQEGSSRITRIVTGLKDFARIDTDPRQETFTIEKLFSSSLIIVGHLIRQSTDHFTQAIEPELPEITGHFQKLEQVVINLLRNACQALVNREQTITLNAARVGENQIAIRISDTGQGIAPSDLPHVFEPFFTTRRESGGTGLGLSVAFGIAHEHGGHMTIESALDSGTTVSLILPVVQATA